MIIEKRKKKKRVGESGKKMDKKKFQRLPFFWAWWICMFVFFLSAPPVCVRSQTKRLL